MQFRVRGIDRASGQPVNPFTVDALSEDDAIAQAAQRSIFIESITKCEASPPVLAGPIREPDQGGDANSTKSNPALVQGVFVGVMSAVSLLALGVVALLVFWPCGIVLIFAGLAAPLSAIGSVKGLCPYCGYALFSTSRSGGVTCRACKKRCVIREKRFHRVE
jgi:hypothetical protein